MKQYKCDGSYCNESRNDKPDDWLMIGSSNGRSLEIVNNIPGKNLIVLSKHGDLHFCSKGCFSRYFFKEEYVSGKEHEFKGLKPSESAKLNRGESLDPFEHERKQSPHGLTRAQSLREVEHVFGMGCALICRERARQKEVKGYDIERDKHLYDDEQLAKAAVTYAVRLKPDGADRSLWWPWDKKYWNPTPENRTREFEKAGALLAAQLDVDYSKKE